MFNFITTQKEIFVGVASSKVTPDDVQRMQELREDIIILLKDDPAQFKVHRLSDGPGTELKLTFNKIWYTFSS